MYKKRFGKLVAALRRERMEDGKPWSRAKFAQISGIEEDILANIENGRKAILFPSLLAQLADALQLVSGERREFFLAASGIEEEGLYPLDAPQSALKQMLAALESLHLPALLLDQYFDIIAANSMIMELYKVTPADFLESQAHPAIRFNLMRALFAPEFSGQISMLGKEQAKFLPHAVMLFRSATLRYRATPYYKCLRAQLNALEEFRRFNQISQIHENYVDNNLSFTIHHSNYGPIKAASATASATSAAGELQLVMLAPLDKATSQLFARLAEKRYIVDFIKDWPQKRLQQEACEKAAR